MDMNTVSTVVEIQGVSIWAKGRSAGNQYVSAGLLRTRMDGGTAQIYIEYKEDGIVAGTATFKLEKDEAIKLIDGLKQIYNLEAA